MQRSRHKQTKKDLEVTPDTLADLAAVFKSAASGDFSKRITKGGTLGIMDRLSKDVNKTLSLMEEKMQGLQRCNIDLEESLKDLQAQQKEIEREKLLEDAIISYLGEGMVVVDTTGAIIVMNERARDMFGVAPHEMVHGTNYASHLIITDARGKRVSKQRHPLEHVLEQQKQVKISLADDYFCRTKHNKIFPVMITVSPLKIEGKMRGAVAIFHDVTEEKRIDEIKSDFISIASHQLRTPLTVMNLHTEMLLAGHGGELTPEQKEYLGEIAFYNKKMTQLLNDFLVVSKIELGTFAIESKPVDLRILFDDVLQEHRVAIIHKKLKIKKSYGLGFPLIHTDPTLIRIVFQNILTNAVKYTPKEGTVVLGLSREQDGVIASISDTGIGIPKEEHSRIFTKLYRGSNARKRDSDGSGLGLYIAKAIIEKSGGSISFTSPIGPKGTGTTFSIHIPLSRGE